MRVERSIGRLSILSVWHELIIILARYDVPLAQLTRLADTDDEARSAVPEEGKNFKLSARNIISIVTYTLAACLGGFCPIAAYIIVAAVSAWWIFPERKNEKHFSPHKNVGAESYYSVFLLSATAKTVPTIITDNATMYAAVSGSFSKINDRNAPINGAIA